MDRRYGNSGVSNSYTARTSNSFIPTSPHAKLPQHQIQQIALQSQLQAQSQLRVSNNASDTHDNAQNNYQHVASQNRHVGTLPTRNTVPANLQLQQHIHSRSQTKQFSSHYGHSNNNSSTNNAMTNHVTSNSNIYYGNSTGQNQNSSSIPNPNWRYSTQPQIQKELQTMPSIQPVIKQIQQQHVSTRISHYQPAETEGLPQTLVDSMRTLFDILDDTKVGKIRLSDIETRWETNDANGSNAYKGNTGAEPLIKMGVMGYLKKVTPPDGLLTFDRFCAGLRLALLTNNNNHIGQNQLILPPTQANVLNQTNPNQQFSLQQHVRNMTSNLQSANATQQSTAHPQTNVKSNNNNNNSNNENHSSVTTYNGNTSAQRISKIPNISSSRLPMPNSSALPVSPHNRSSGNVYGNIHAGNTYQNSGSRLQTNAEQGTTIAMIHQVPPHTTKSTDNSIYSKTNDHTTGTLKFNKQNSNPVLGKENRHNAKNGSLDNLIAENESKAMESKERPPSAPLLDASDSYVDEKNRANNASASRGERARSQVRDNDERNQNRRKSPAEEMSFGKRVVSFVTPRQRTLSMPQLQVNKLKPKSINLEIETSISPESSASPISSGDGVKHQIPSISKMKYKSQLVPPVQISNGPAMQKQKSDSSVLADMRYSGQNKGLNDGDQPPPPPKPPRNSTLTITTMSSGSSIHSPPLLSGSSTGSEPQIIPSKPEIRNVLQTWQKGMAYNKPDEVDGSNETIVAEVQVSVAGNENNGKGEKKVNLRRRETARRHTVQSGIDFTTLKRLKQLEQERDVLQQGTTYIENTRDWYLKQLDMVNDKINLLTKGTPTSDYWSECHEERLNLLGCRISEVNNLLTALMDGSSRLPLHMNLQIPSHLSMKTITRLKEQNRQLTQEVSDCSHRVTQLETEKAMLLRQLFHQKNTVHSDETVYM